jgi:zinc/manganese transport system permease protein
VAGFLRDAYLAGLPVAAASGLVGYFLVPRAQVFAVDALGHVAYTGAVAALAFGIDPRLGLLVATLAVGALLARLGPAGRADDVVIGSVFAWVLGLGVLFLSLYTRRRSAGDSAANVSYLFGSIFGLPSGSVWLAVAVGVAALAALAALGRPLLFAGLDPVVAATRGVPVRRLELVLLLVAAVVVAEASQIVGALLVLGLTAAPAATAARLTARPFAAMLLAPALGAAGLASGLLLATVADRIPPSCAVIGVVTATYLAARLAPRTRVRRPALHND